MAVALLVSFGGLGCAGSTGLSSINGGAAHRPAHGGGGVILPTKLWSASMYSSGGASAN